MPSTRRVVSRDPDVGRRLDARRPVVGVVVAEARSQRRAGHEEGHDQGDGQLHGVVRQAQLFLPAHAASSNAAASLRAWRCLMARRWRLLGVSAFLRNAPSTDIVGNKRVCLA